MPDSGFVRPEAIVEALQRVATSVQTFGIPLRPVTVLGMLSDQLRDRTEYSQVTSYELAKDAGER